MFFLAVIAESFERIHRSNLVGMGILPLQFLEGQSAKTLGLTGREEFTIHIPNDVRPGQVVEIEVYMFILLYFYFSYSKQNSRFKKSLNKLTTVFTR